MLIFIHDTVIKRIKKIHRIQRYLDYNVELAWESPFNCPIYKISAELHVKEVENYSMKQAAHKFAIELKSNIWQYWVYTW